MSLNIKNPRVHELAQQAAKSAGLTQTGAIELALERLLASLGEEPRELEVDRRVDLVRRLVAEYSADPGRSEHPVQRVEDLYDEAGMPA